MKTNLKVLFICRDAELSRVFGNLMFALRIDMDAISEIDPLELQKIIKNGIDGIIIDLSEAPAQGRDIGIYLRKYKPSRFLPLIFLDGSNESVERIRNILPDAFYIGHEEVKTQLPSILEIINENPVVPASVFEAYKNVPLDKKLGILPGMRILSINEPNEFRGKLTVNDLILSSDITKDNDIIFWFLSTQEQISEEFHHILPAIGKGGIWMFWQKKQPNFVPYFNEIMVRKLGLDNGLVDYKVCSVDSEWTGLKFAIRKKPKIVKDENGKKYEVEGIRLITNIAYIRNKPVIVLGDLLIPIEIHYDKRKNVLLRLEKDPKLVVKSPKGISEEKIIQAVTYRMNWIVKKLKQRDEIQPFPSKFSYVNGEKHLYFGKEYELRIQSGKKARAWFSEPFIEVEVPDPSDVKQVQDTLQTWYADQTMEYVSQRTWHYIMQFIPKKIHPTIEFKFRKMKSRWGSCSRKGLITFNKDLIRASQEAIDYLIVHELCHLKHFNHGPDFYKELTKIMPNWKENRKMLERISLG